MEQNRVVFFFFYQIKSQTFVQERERPVYSNLLQLKTCEILTASITITQNVTLVVINSFQKMPSCYGSSGKVGSLFSGSLSKQFRQIPGSKWQFYAFLSFGWAPARVVISVRFLAACFLALQLTVHWGKQTTITTLWLLVMPILHPLQTKEAYTSLPQFG